MDQAQGNKIMDNFTPLRDYWVTPSKGGWSVRFSGSRRALSFHATQSAAWNDARRLARGAGAEAVLFGKAGAIVTSNNYAKTDEQG